MNICSEQSEKEAPVGEHNLRSRSASEVVLTQKQRQLMERRLSLASQGERRLCTSLY